jgi:hypothetical protein
MRVLLIAILFFPLAYFSFGDEWIAPTKQVIYSQNRLFCLVIQPSIIPKGYEKELEKRKNNPDKYLSKPLKDTIIPCIATLYRTNTWASVFGGQVIWSKKLENPLSPYSAFISNDGKYVVTFDDWGKLGYGENVLVIYGESGNLLNKYKLHEVLPSNTIELLETVTSIWWYQGVETYSERPSIITILIKVKDQNIIKRNYNLSTLSFEN